MQGAFPGVQAGIRNQGKQETSVSRSTWVQDTQKAGSLQMPQWPQTHAVPLPSLTWPLMSGFAPIAVCSSFTSLVGPVMSEVPVSTMASQPPLHRVSPLATSTLGRDAQRGDNP